MSVCVSTHIYIWLEVSTHEVTFPRGPSIGVKRPAVAGHEQKGPPWWACLTLSCMAQTSIETFISAWCHKQTLISVNW